MTRYAAALAAVHGWPERIEIDGFPAVLERAETDPDGVQRPMYRFAYGLRVVTPLALKAACIGAKSKV